MNSLTLVLPPQHFWGAWGGGGRLIEGRRVLTFLVSTKSNEYSNSIKPFICTCKHLLLANMQVNVLYFEMTVTCVKTEKRFY